MARETSEFPPMLRRLFRAYAARVAAGDTYDLREMWELREAFDEAIADAITAGRELQPESFSWAGIADALGTSRQSVQQWHARRSER